VEGKKQYLYDEHGRRYLDAFAGIATVCCGHSHPDIIDAITAQARRLQHSTVLYLNHAIADFAEALASKMPGDLKARTHMPQIKQLRQTLACSLLDGA
jgi:alanine-glyoxylate transaminase/(R)-3-amino-2-methylpropionate-pyruvate transaminase